MIPQSIVDLVEICALKGIQHAVISPGSRNAPLTIAFARHSKIKCISVSDERSAAFIALGMALKTGRTTVLICTSGSAAYNYAPAIAEAYFSNIPLLILTADRPPEWIDQLDGQTIYQENIYGTHVKKFYRFPSQDNFDDATWYAHRLINEAINLSEQLPKGPVHINVPFREPFYPSDATGLSPSPSIKIIDEQNPSLFEEISIDEFNRFRKILIVVGQCHYNEQFRASIKKIAKKIPVVADVISNLNGIEGVIQHQDLFLKSTSNYHLLYPDLIITFGKSVISKNLKLFVRSASKVEHWHVQMHGYVADTFQQLSRIIKYAPDAVTQILSQIAPALLDETFVANWARINQSCKSLLATSINQAKFSEFKVYYELSKLIPDTMDLHLANSMAVRYFNFIGIDLPNINVYCNRGTSGIDGSVSTALGSALCTDSTVLLITGDMAFFYDRNAFWHQNLPSNLKIIVLNNQGGGIFRLINGPGQQPELEEFFETKQSLSARHLASEYGFDYYPCNNLKSLIESFRIFIQPGKNVSILEVDTHPTTNKNVYDQIMSGISESLN